MMRPILGGLVAGTAIGLVACTQPAPPAGAASAMSAGPAAQRAPTSQGLIVAPDLPPLSAAAVASGPRPVETIRAVYEFAARHPEVLRYVPCFCGCETAGHEHNADCFVAGRTTDGAVTSWDYHGVG